MKWKISNKDKMNHFVNNLAQYIMLWDKNYLDLYWKVQKVKWKKDFKDFCVQSHNDWKSSVDELYNYFR